jgi:ubiquitin carboxyl-terminal hydrolase 4/11
LLTPRLRPGTVLKRFNTKRPRWTSTDEFLPPQLQNLFELCFFQEEGWIPTGWHAVDGSRNFEKLSSRVPEEPSPVDHDTPGTWTNGATDEESGEEAATQASNQTRMADESSEEDASPQPIKVSETCRESVPGTSPTWQPDPSLTRRRWRSAARNQTK